MCILENYYVISWARYFKIIIIIKFILRFHFQRYLLAACPIMTSAFLRECHVTVTSCHTQFITSDQRAIGDADDMWPLMTSLTIMAKHYIINFESMAVSCIWSWRRTTGCWHPDSLCSVDHVVTKEFNIQISPAIRRRLVIFKVMSEVIRGQR